jgi:hypothetical protein
MYLIHYIIPLAIYHFVRSKILLLGLLLANLVDLDHIYFRIIGIVPWFESMCTKGHFWNCGSFGFYPVHSVYLMISVFIVSIILFFLMKKDKLKITKLMFWISIGILIHFSFDLLHLLVAASLP